MSNDQLEYIDFIAAIEIMFLFRSYLPQKKLSYLQLESQFNRDMGSKILIQVSMGSYLNYSQFEELFENSSFMAVQLNDYRVSFASYVTLTTINFSLIKLII